jgi:23S rRNA pseudouridine1911/1915/1917 synthase
MANLEISRAQRLDQRVVQMIPELSRAFGTKLIEQGRVTVNGEPVTKAGYKLREGDEVVIDYSLNEREQIPEITLDILYEDDDCVVIVKPLGLLTHSKGEFNPEPTVETWLRSHTKQPAEMLGLRAGIVHRLDRATSGVMICAKTPEALKWLQKQFAQRRSKKTYYAVVSGEFKQPEAIIDMPVERNPKAPATFRVGHAGKSAVTQYKVLKSDGKFSLVELKPTTGRTHQLRVHLSHLGHPIVGDQMYGGEKAERMMLHAESLELTLPNRERATFTAPMPKEFSEYVDA